MKARKYYGVTLELAREVNAKAAARKAEQAAFDAEMLAIVEAAEAERAVREPACNVCGEILRLCVCMGNHAHR